MARKVNLFYIEVSKDLFTVFVMHRQVSGHDQVCAGFCYGRLCTVSFTRALKAGKVFCKQMNAYYPTKLDWSFKTK